MQRQNKEEFLLLVEEKNMARRAATKYIGFVIGGSALIFAAWGGIAAFSGFGSGNAFPIGYSAITVSFVPLCVLSVLIYNFISHNRAAGYCMLLSIESWKSEGEVRDHLFIFEPCAELLRRKDADIEYKRKMIKNYGEEYKEYSAHESYSYLNNTIKGLCLFAKTIIGHQKTSSWGYPISIMRILSVITIMCYLFGCIVLFKDLNLSSQNNYLRLTNNVGFYVILSTFCIQCVLWLHICNRFYDIMRGSSTVISFYRRLKVVRKIVLEKYGISATWIDIGLGGPFEAKVGANDEDGRPATQTNVAA